MSHLVVIDGITYIADTDTDEDNSYLLTDENGYNIEPIVVDLDEEQIVTILPLIEHNTYIEPSMTKMFPESEALRDMESKISSRLDLGIYYACKYFPLSQVTKIGLGSGLYGDTYATDDNRLKLKKPIHVQDDNHFNSIIKASIETKWPKLQWLNDEDIEERSERMNSLYNGGIFNYDDWRELDRLYNLWFMVTRRIDGCLIRREEFKKRIHNYIIEFTEDDEDYPLDDHHNAIIELPINRILGYDYDGIVTSTEGVNLHQPRYNDTSFIVLNDSELVEYHMNAN